VVVTGNGSENQQRPTTAGMVGTELPLMMEGHMVMGEDIRDLRVCFWLVLYNPMAFEDKAVEKTSHQGFFIFIVVQNMFSVFLIHVVIIRFSCNISLLAKSQPHL
jgi:hypothetical protein